MPPADHPATTPAAHAGEATATRERLLHAGLRLFALHGYSKTSTRELAEAAQVNIAAISYYFSDKAGLYRAVFEEPLAGEAAAGDTAFADPALTLEQALRGFYAGFLEPLRHGDLVRLCMKLHFREFLEPTGLWGDSFDHGLRPSHEALLQVICRAWGLQSPDAAAHRLAIGLAGLGVHLHVGYDINESLSPGLMQGDDAVDRWTEHLVHWGLAMVQAEQQRRAQAAAPRARTPTAPST